MSPFGPNCTANRFGKPSCYGTQVQGFKAQWALCVALCHMRPRHVYAKALSSAAFMFVLQRVRDAIIKVNSINISFLAEFGYVCAMTCPFEFWPNSLLRLPSVTPLKSHTLGIEKKVVWRTFCCAHNLNQFQPLQPLQHACHMAFFVKQLLQWSQPYFKP